MSSLDTVPHNFFLFCFTETQYRSKIKQWQSGIQIWMNSFSAIGAAAKLDWSRSEQKLGSILVHCLSYETQIELG